MVAKSLVLLAALLLGSSAMGGRGGAYFSLADFDRYSIDGVTLGGFYETPIGGYIFLGMQGEYWNLDLKSNDFMVTDFAMSGYGKLYMPTTINFTPYLKGGAALHLLEYSHRTYSDSERELGMDVALGSMVRFSSVFAGLEYQIRKAKGLGYSQVMVSVSQFL